MPAVSTMMFRCLMLLVVLAASAAIIGSAIPTNADGAFGKTILTLRPAARFDSPILRIADIAEVSGGDPKTRDQIAALDLADSPALGENLEITPPQIEFRLRLAGIDVRQVVIRGATLRIATAHAGAKFSGRTALVNSTSTSGSNLERIVLNAAKNALLPRLSWPEDDVIIQLAQPLPREWREAAAIDGVICTAEVRSTGVPLGRVPLRMSLEVPGQRTLECPLQFDVRHFENVIVASKSIAQGQSVTSADLNLDRQDTTHLVGYLSSPTSLIGQKAKRNIAAGQVIRATDANGETRSTQPPLVKRRDRVKVIAKSGVLTVSISGESLQDGRAGDVIKIRNVDSNAIVHGRVISATEVEVLD